MPSQRYHKVSLATTNEAVIKAAPGEITGWFITNKSAFYRFVKLFDASVPPPLAVTTPKLTLGIPMLSSANVGFDSPLTFDTGITIAMVSGIPIGAGGPVAADDLAVDIFYE